MMPLLPGAVPRSSPGEKCRAGETSRAILQAQDPPEVGGVVSRPSTAVFFLRSYFGIL